MKKSILAYLICFLLAPSVWPGPSPASVLDEPRGKLSYVVKIQDAPIGILTETWETQPDGRHFQLYMEMELSRMGVPMTMSMTQSTVETESGRLIRFQTSMDASQMSSSTEGEVRGDTIYWTSSSFGYSQQHRLPWQEGAIGIGSANLVNRDRLLAGQKDFKLDQFDPERGEFKSLRIVNQGMVTDTVAGQAGQFLKIEQYEGTQKGAAVSLLDADMVPVKTVLRIMAMTIVIELSDVEKLDDLDIQGVADIISSSQISLPAFPVPPDQLEDITLSITFPEPIDSGQWFDAPNQMVVNRDETRVDLLLSRKIVTFTSLLDQDQKVYLQPDRFIQSDHPDIRSRAEDIYLTTQAEGWQLVEEMATWVNGYIDKKDYGTGFASALEVLGDRTGDCSEHSVLVVALLRAAGIPARVVSGLAYSKGNLIGHMWAEAHVDYWRTVDALDLELHPIRIRLSAAEDSRTLSMLDMTGAFSLFSDTNIQVKNYTIRQKKK